jgi:hypothetical protein
MGQLVCSELLVCSEQMVLLVCWEHLELMGQRVQLVYLGLWVCLEHLVLMGH